MSPLVLRCLVLTTAAAIAADVPPPRTVAEEAAVLATGRLSARQRAMARLAVHPDPQASAVLLEQWERYRQGQLAPTLWLDLFEALGRRDDPRLRELVAEREKEVAQSRDPLSRFRECLEGGNADVGREIFEKKPEAGCVRCHAIEGRGGQIGPDLTWLRKSIERIRILESLITPNATIAPGFQSVTLTLKNGESVAGVVNSEADDAIVLTAIADGKPRKIAVADIAERAPLPSPMPPHFGTILDKRAIRDLVEFIAVGD
jgi:putative heme-binding domain-containing protein